MKRLSQIGLRIGVLVVVMALAVTLKADDPLTQYYVFATDTQGETFTLNFFDPTTLAVVKTIELTKPNSSRSIETFISPDGRYIVIVVIPKFFQSDSQVILFNVETETAELVDFNIPSYFMGDYTGDLNILSLIVWSSDSRYIAFIEGTGNSDSNIEVYDVVSGDLTRINTSPQEYMNLAWSHDNLRLAVTTIKNCDAGCQTRIEIYDVASQQLERAYNVLDEHFAPLHEYICELNWSPENDYLSFLSICDGSRFGNFKEVYVMDVASGEVTNTTHLTEFALPMTDPPNKDIVGRFALYNTLWLDSTHLLIGASYAVITSGNFLTETFLYDVTTHTFTSIADYDIQAFARSSQASVLAISSSSEPFDFSESQIRIVDVRDPFMFTDLAVFPGGCDLSWSFSGDILAYTYWSEMRYGCRFTVDALVFWDEDPYTFVEYSVANFQDVHPIGWVVGQP